MIINFAVITISDRAYNKQREDSSGLELQKLISSKGWSVVTYLIIPDDEETIFTKLIELSHYGNVSVILTTGGTGFSSRDITPEATGRVIEKNAPGIAEYLRSESFKITPHAALSRGIAGIRNNKLIVNLPGSPKAVIEHFHILANIIPHAVELLTDSPDAESNHPFTLISD